MNSFAQLPPELLTLIYEKTANAEFPLTSKNIYNALANDHARFHFCVNIFDPTQYWGLEDEYPDLSVPQTTVLRQKWFTPAFAERVEAECRSRVSSTASRLVPRTMIGARLPSYCLRPPWTADKVALLHSLTSWGVRANWTKEKRRYPGLPEAIEEGHEKVVSAYLNPNVNCALEEADVMRAIEIEASKSILECLVTSLFGYGPIDMAMWYRVHDALSEKEPDSSADEALATDEQTALLGPTMLGRTVWTHLMSLMDALAAPSEYDDDYSEVDDLEGSVEIGEEDFLDELEEETDDEEEDEGEEGESDSDQNGEQEGNVEEMGTAEHMEEKVEAIAGDKKM